MPELKLNDVTIQLAETRICQSLTLTLKPGQIWAVLGRNGSGKTTLLHHLAGLAQQHQGQITWDNHAVHHIAAHQRAQDIGILLQLDDSSFPCTVMETALLGRHPHIKRWKHEDDLDHQIAEQALQKMELTPFKYRNIQTLSGGEQRRLAIATLLAQQPSVYLLDEPTNHLDLNHQIKVLNLFKSLANEQQALVIMVMHDINLAHRYASHVLLLHEDGSWQAGARDDIMQTDSLSKLYQHPLSYGTKESWIPI